MQTEAGLQPNNLPTEGHQGNNTITKSEQIIPQQQNEDLNSALNESKDVLLTKRQPSHDFKGYNPLASPPDIQKAQTHGVYSIYFPCSLNLY